MSDLSERAKSILSKVDLVACEDTRHSGLLLKRINISANLISFHQHNTQKRLVELINKLQKGTSIALISDAGLPGICDPGEELVAEAKKFNIKVFCIPGPCAGITALVSSGLSTNRFCFEGFLPSKQKDRNKIISQISKETRTTILYESRYKLIQLLEELATACGDERPIQIAKELTKFHEEFIGPNLGTVKAYFKENEPRGEFTIILGGQKKASNEEKKDNQELIDKMKRLISEGYSSSNSAKHLSEETGLSKRYLYSLLHDKISTDNLDKQ